MIIFMSDDYIWDLRRICKLKGHIPKPCPFCGREAQLEYVHAPFVTLKTNETQYLGIYTTVQCTNAFCSCRIGNYEDPIMAIEAWNKRVEGK